MDDVKLDRKAMKTKEEQELEDLIFVEKSKEDHSPNSKDSEDSKSETESIDDGNKEQNRRSLLNRASLTNVLPVDKFKNGANNAGKLLGTTLSKMKEKSAGAYESAKSSNAGSKLSEGLTKAVAAGSGTIGKLKETDTYKASSTFASAQYGRTSSAACATLEKAKAGASIGLEKAKLNATSLRAKVGGQEKS